MIYKYKIDILKFTKNELAVTLLDDTTKIKLTD